MRAAGTALLLCTHDFHEAATLCDHVHLLVCGRLAASLAPPVGADATRALEERYRRELGVAPPPEP